MNNSPLTICVCRFITSFSLIVLLIGGSPHVSYANAAATPATDGSHQVFLPLVVGEQGTKQYDAGCHLNAEESALAQLLTSAPDQQRTGLQCNGKLSALARSRAEDMARRGYFAHVNPDGYGPNFLATQAGYKLPAHYDHSLTGNNIESIGAGAGSAEDMWNAWMQSPSHSTHILGAADFYREQFEYGIGFVKVDQSSYTYYWVVITAAPDSGS